MSPDAPILTPFLDDYDVIVYAGDCIETMRRLPADSVDAIVTDPPYGIGFMGKEWDVMDGDARSWASFGGPTGKRHTGGTGSSDAGGAMKAGQYDLTTRGMHRFQAFSEAWAREAYRVLKPGGHLLAFAGTRTYHRMASGVEDAGFEIRDCIAWIYGSGFPKSLDVSKAIDKRPGVDRRAEFAAHLRERRINAGLTRSEVSSHVVGTRSGACWNWEHHQFPKTEWWPALRDLLNLDEEWADIIREAERERVGVVGASSLAVAPGQGTDRGRVDLGVTTPTTPAAHKWDGWGTALKPAYEPIVVARKPLIGTVAENVLTHGAGALNIDACRIAHDGIGLWGTINRSNTRGVYGSFGDEDGKKPTSERNPAGRWPANVALDETAAYILDAQSGTSTSTIGQPRSGANGDGWGMTRTGAEYADTGGASRFFYTAKASRQDRNAGGLADNTHPTVKPTELMRWLVRLVTPPGGIVLDPFGGSGSTGLACRAENMRCILIEREPEYLQIISDRLAQLSLFAEEIA